MGRLPQELFSLMPQNVFQVQWWHGDLSSTAIANSRSSGLGFLHSHRCVSVQFPGPGLTLKKHKHLHSLSLTDYKPAEQVTLTFLESSDLVVYNYHKAWMDLFYDQEARRYKSKPLNSGLERQRDCRVIVAPGNLNPLEENMPPQTTAERPIVHSIELYGLIPESLPAMDFGFDKSDYMRFSITYKLRDWKIITLQRDKVSPPLDKAKQRLGELDQLRERQSNPGDVVALQSNILSSSPSAASTDAGQPRPLTPDRGRIGGSGRSFFAELGL